MSTADPEADRLAALRRHGILDTDPELPFDRMVALVRATCGVPIALVSLIDADRQWFKARSGVEIDQTPLDTSVCALAIRQRDVFQIEDLAADPRTAAMSLVAGEPHIRFYAGAPLITGDGIALGALCAIDTAPRPGGLSQAQASVLAMLADQVVATIEMRSAVVERDRALAGDERLISARVHEARYHAIVDSAVDSAILAVDDDGRVTSWSRGAERIFGWSEAEILGHPFAVLFTPEDRADGAPEREMRLARESGRASGERWRPRKDGGRFHAHSALTPLRGGSNAGFVALMRDITEEYANREALIASREKLELATRASRLGQFDYFPQTGHLEWDDRCRELFGLSPGVPVSYEGAYLAGLHPEDREKGAREVLAALDPRGSHDFDLEYRTVGIEDGVERFIHARGAALFDGDTPLRLIGTVQDVTEDRRIRQAQQESSERVHLALAAGAIIGTWLWDLPSDRFTVDEPFARALGLDPAIGRDGLSLSQVMATAHPDDQRGLASAIAEAISQGGPYAHQYRVRRADGRYYWIEANGRVEKAADGAPLRFPGVLLDLEARRAVEQERDRANEELRALTATLEQRVTERTAELLRAEDLLRQSQKMEAVGQLTGGLAHDFNNLLAGISGALELIGKRLAQGRVQEVDKYILAAQDAARRAAAVTHRLLAFSRRQTLDPRPTDVNALVDGMSELIRRTVGPGVRIDTVAAPDLWTALVDPSQLENALLNLCLNGRDAMPDGGRITIQTTNVSLDPPAARAFDMSEGEYLSLSVTDTGAGMAPELMDKIFEPFFTTKPLGHGTGLGLSMIYGFAKQSGGQVRARSDIGHGATVTIYLPRYAGEAVDEDAASGPRPPDPADPGRTVLIVDDEATVRLLLVDVLKERGYTVLEAADSAAGLAMLRSDVAIDLMVSDVGLPGGMNGRQMAEAGRERRPGLKVLFITGYAETSLFGQGRLAAGMQVLTKPFAVDALVSRVGEMLAR